MDHASIALLRIPWPWAGQTFGLSRRSHSLVYLITFGFSYINYHAEI